MEEARQAEVYGVRPKRTFEESAAKYVIYKQDKRSIRDDISRLNLLLPMLGQYTLEELHMGNLLRWIDKRKSEGVKNNTINHGLKVVRQILNLAATEWIDEYRLTWLLSAPKVKLLPLNDKALPTVISWEIEQLLFNLLPPHIRDMALFAINTGCRDQEICHLRWEWEYQIEGSDIFVFIIPKEFVKNNRDRLVVLNKIARDVVNSRRNIHSEYVFSYRGNRLYQILNTGWKNARFKVGT